MSQEKQWHLIDANGTQCGPYMEEQLRSWANDGTIAPTTQVWTDGLEGWIPASDVAGLFPNQPKRPQHSSPKVGDGAAMRMLLPVGRSGLAIGAGYVALGSLLCGILAPVAVVLGILALKDIKKYPDKHGKGRAWFAIILGGLLTVAYAVLLVLLFTSS
jgi:hypothetical protein